MDLINILTLYKSLFINYINSSIYILIDKCLLVSGFTLTTSSDNATDSYGVCVSCRVTCVCIICYVTSCKHTCTMLMVSYFSFYFLFVITALVNIIILRHVPKFVWSLIWYSALSLCNKPL
jgi:hypothetical protein